MNLKKYLPYTLRLFLKVRLRQLKDLRSFDYKLFNHKRKHPVSFEHAISITQQVKMNANFENKLKNLQKGIDAIDGIVVQPGEIFSFWKNVQKPTRKNGFELSRNIVSGEVKEDYGGGLCQLSSILYHLSLIAGLEIKERFNHSVDIYKEEDRFTPLGADATVVYGYKDLRIRNQFAFPVRLSLSIDKDQLNCVFSSPEKIHERSIEFHRSETGNSIEVATLKNMENEQVLLNKSIYKRK